jgi:hypothetical protein
MRDTAQYWRRRAAAPGGIRRHSCNYSWYFASHLGEGRIRPFHDARAGITEYMPRPLRRYIRSTGFGPAQSTRTIVRHDLHNFASGMGYSDRVTCGRAWRHRGMTPNRRVRTGRLAISAGMRGAVNRGSARCPDRPPERGIPRGRAGERGWTGCPLAGGRSRASVPASFARCRVGYRGESRGCVVIDRLIRAHGDSQRRGGVYRRGRGTYREVRRMPGFSLRLSDQPVPARHSGR